MWYYFDVIGFKMAWIVGVTIYKRNGDGFLMANFKHVLLNGVEPFVFLSQVQQVFYFDDSSKPRWKVILHKKTWNKHMFLNTYGEYINTNEYGHVLDAQGDMPNAPTNPSNVGAIFLSREESLLFNESMQVSVERQTQGVNSRR